MSRTACIQSCFNGILSAYRVSARSRNIEWALTKEWFQELIQRPCYYCGGPLSNLRNRHGIAFRYNGIDRLDNSKGYTQDNCIPSCTFCNHAKMNLDIGEFAEWAQRLGTRMTEFRVTYEHSKPFQSLIPDNEAQLKTHILRSHFVIIADYILELPVSRARQLALDSLESAFNWGIKAIGEAQTLRQNTLDARVEAGECP